MPSPRPRVLHEAARIHHICWRRGSRLALAVRAQSAVTLRVGMVGGLPRSSAPYAAFLQRLAELGHQQGTNLAFEFIQVANIGDYARSNQELVARGVNVLVAAGTEISLEAAMAASGPLTIVMLAIGYDHIALGYVKSLARPTGNITGISLRQIELTIKRLHVVKDAFPDLRAATVFWDGVWADQFRAAQSAAPALGV